ncbi:hypothetical protein [Ramlibacter sp.]|uniref:MuF-C-terminal domain-containing protein n=1 Tax=Ramlibacter sp. TaxID=1917967 RepID=UPI003D0E19B5
MSYDAYVVAIQLLLKECQAGRPSHERVLVVSRTPECLIECGFSQLPLVVTGKVVDKAHFDHGVTKGVLERLPLLVENPRAIYASASQELAAVVVTLEVKGGNNIVVPVHRDRQVGRHPARFNVIASVYDKRAEVEAGLRSKGLLLWEKPKK